MLARAGQMHPRCAGRDQRHVATRDFSLAAEAAPRGGDSNDDLSHDMSYDNAMAAPRGRHGDRDTSLALDQIGARIERIEHEIVADVFRYLARNPGARAGEIAAGLGAAQGVVSAHLYRGKGRMFASRAGRWYPVPEGDPG